MAPENAKLVTINGGSSSIKFAVYRMDENPECELTGKIERIGLASPEFTVTYQNDHKKCRPAVQAADFKQAAHCLIDWLEKQPGFGQVKCVGHRIVHGLKHTHAEIIEDGLLDDLKKIQAYDPDHLPAEIEMAQMFKSRHPALPQVACFDTAFHTTMPRKAKILPIPRRFYEAGVQRYGFHGLSYTYLMQALAGIAGSGAASGRVILAHLGSGASLAAVKEGKSIDTTMGFTPAAGLVMGTRSGDLDPGVAWYIMQSENLGPEQFNQLINHQAGLLGVAETSPDMQELLRIEKDDARAAEAIDLFCYSIKKWTGAFIAALGGLDILVFSGGIGENAPAIRARVCEGMGYAGIRLHEAKNTANELLVSSPESAVKVYVIPTNEELMIAKSTMKVYSEAAGSK